MPEGKIVHPKLWVTIVSIQRAFKGSQISLRLIEMIICRFQFEMDPIEVFERPFKRSQSHWERLRRRLMSQKFLSSSAELGWSRLLSANYSTAPSRDLNVYVVCRFSLLFNLTRSAYSSINPDRVTLSPESKLRYSLSGLVPSPFQSLPMLMWFYL
jgi:hypothetical protein